MSLTSPISCVSGVYSLYRVYFFWIYCNFYHSTNQIRSIMSLNMMGLTPSPLVRVLFLFTLMNLLVVLDTPLVVLTNPLVVSVAWGLEFFFRQKSSQLVMLFCWSCSYKN